MYFVKYRRWSVKWRNFPYILLFEFNRGAKQAAGSKHFRRVQRQCHRGKYRKEIVSTVLLSPELYCPRSEKSSGVDEDRLNSLIHDDSRQSSRELTNVKNFDQSTIVKLLYSMGKVQKLGAWIPFALSEKQQHK